METTFWQTKVRGIKRLLRRLHKPSFKNFGSGVASPNLAHSLCSLHLSGLFTSLDTLKRAA
jgi:hypothetical protein